VVPQKCSAVIAAANLTRARQGIVIVVPPGATADPTRDLSFCDPTYGKPPALLFWTEGNLYFVSFDAGGDAMVGGAGGEAATGA